VNLTQGTYEVCEILKPGWIQTSPSTNGTNQCHTVIINSGDVFDDGKLGPKDFGNFKLGAIHGLKFEDFDGNGTKDGQDAGLEGWTITINGTDTITNEDVSNSTVTNSTGFYWFTGLTQGNYTVCENLMPGWIQTSPGILGFADCHNVIVNSGTISTGNDFGNFELGAIHGQKFNDIDGNGTQDEGDDGLPGWTITINGTDTITDEDVSNSTVTNSTGFYWFTGLTQGNYTVCENLQSGWNQTFPGGAGCHNVIVNSGDVYDDGELGAKDFGNTQTGKIIIIKDDLTSHLQ